MTQLLLAGRPQFDLDAFSEGLAGKVDYMTVASLTEAARRAREGAAVVLLECREEPRQALQALQEMRSAVETVDTPVLALTGLVEGIEALSMGATAISHAPSDAALVAEEIRRLAGKGAEGKTDLQFLPDWITLELPDGAAKEMADRMARANHLVLQISPECLRLVAEGEEPMALEIPMSWDGPLTLNAGIRWVMACDDEFIGAYPIDCIQVYAQCLPPLGQTTNEPMVNDQ